MYDRFCVSFADIHSQESFIEIIDEGYFCSES